MKYLQLPLVIAVQSFIALPALATPVTMLQFGSFESRQEAESRLNTLKEKHGSALGALDLSVREVALPPDNLTVYRTQAGPVAGRLAGQTICEGLARSGDECYIVETAMLPSMKPLAAAPAAPATPVAKTTLPVVPEAAPAQPVAAKPSALKVEPAPAATVVKAPSSNMHLPPVRMPAATGMQPAPVAATSKASPAVAAPIVAATNPAAASAIAPALAAALPAPAEPAPLPAMTPATTADINEMQAALDRAKEELPATQAAFSEAVKPKENAAPSRSFWSRLNPFSDDADDKAAKKAEEEARKKAEQAAAMAAPTEAVEISALTPQEARILPPIAALPDPAPLRVAAPEPLMPLPSTTYSEAPAPALEAAASVTPPVAAPAVPSVAVAAASPAPAPAPQMMAAAVPTITAPPTVSVPPVIMQMEPMQLPPPPAPLKAMTPKAPMVVAAPEPLMQAPLPAPTAPVAPALSGQVQVGEAKRVPLTSATVIPPAPMPPAAQPMPAVPMAIAPWQPAVPLQPSATEGQRATWAQIGPFVDGSQAMAFWYGYRQRFPDFPVVRVRIATPYQVARGSIAPVWLRVGPVTRDGFVRTLCATAVPATESPSALRCGVIADLPTASAAFKQHAGRVPFGRYVR